MSRHRHEAAPGQILGPFARCSNPLCQREVAQAVMKQGLCLRCQIDQHEGKMTGGFALRRIIHILAMTLVLVASAGCGYVNLSDSVGAGIAVRPDQAYPFIIGRTIKADNVHNFAAVGIGVDGMAQLLDEPEVREAVSHADLLTLDVGSNDVLDAALPYLFSGDRCGGADGQDCLRSSLADFETHYQALLDKLRGLTSARVIVLDIYNPFVALTDDVVEDYLVLVNAFIARSACADGFLAARVSLAFNGPDGHRDPGPLISAEGMHPSAEGHAAIAAAIGEAGCP